MALWARAQQLPKDLLEEVRSLYTDNTFPIEVRHFLSQWIEEKLLNIVEPNIQNEQYITGLIGSLIQELETKINNIHGGDLFLMKLKLQEAVKLFRQKYDEDPLRLFHTIRYCLGTEMKLVAQAENLGNTFVSNDKKMPTNPEISHVLGFLKQRLCENMHSLRKIEEEQEAFALHYHECTKLNATLQHLNTQPQNHQNMDVKEKLLRQKELMEQQLSSKLALVLHLRMDFIDKMKETINSLNSLQSKVLDEELISWKRDQQLAGNGATFSSNLDIIQNWCESLADIIWHTRQQIKEAEILKNKFSYEQSMIPDIFPSLNTQITQLLSSLVTSTFIIEKQPPQVMKTNTRFTSTVRLLVGAKLNVHMTPPQVKVSIISESQANALLKNDKMAKNGEASGEILNNTGTMEYHQAAGQLSVSFRNMQLKKIKRAEKKGTESVMDEKFSLLFQSQFSVGGGELVFQVWTLSLPVVVIVHGNQEPHAWATVTWDNAFAEAGRVPFVVPDKVLWRQVAEALNMKFRSATGRALTGENLKFLAEKAFRTVLPDYSNTPLSWAQFCKEPLPERSFTFWEWFYAIMKLTREHLKNPWMDGCILGFIRKKKAEEILATCPPGTFLMRFSDSELGGITIAWVGDQTDQVFMLQPFTSKDFAIRSLGDRVYDLQHLLYLYPNQIKDQVFARYCTPPNDTQTSTNGYIKPQLVVQVPACFTGSQTPSHSSLAGMNNNGQTGPGSYPATPNMFQAHSPDPSVRDTSSVAPSDYATGLGLSSIGPSTNLELEPMDSMDHMNLPMEIQMGNMNQFENIQQMNFNDFMQSYNAIKPQ
ncbi:signal transducer and activator of transcription 5B [Nylanderia fulva]|uniref:signal transducer and activator of transcription 5B n=1 Tax=Nylanderia fulva TaxID=613905 RepID=UPI0010FB8577|nr:signal transducer and activator of transcription 5B [Nylanderia fulva]XP_029171423.1 signal transducer and activator of transcription 5B [Nylanderia fulva]